MYIEPGTNIKLLKNVPLDNTYNDTFSFRNSSEQTNFFNTFIKHNLTKQTYQRVQKGISRVGLSSDKCYDCNYMMFQNTNYGSKWFYAFITKVEYVNDVTCEISFEIDVMQTWYFDYTIKPSFIEREHILDDTIGNNIIDEKLETGEFVEIGLLNNTFTEMELCIVIVTTFDDEGESVSGSMYSDIYSGLLYRGFNSEAEANSFLTQVNTNGWSDGIVSIFMMPRQFFGKINVPETLTIEKNYTSLTNGYIPKNKKLFIYPYNFINVVNGDGGDADYRYELFSKEVSYCRFYYYGDCSANPSVLFYPASYANNPLNYEHGLLMSNFPQCAYNTDLFKAWLAQNSSSIGVTAFSSVMSAIGGGVALSFGNPAGAGMAMSGLSGITNLITEGHKKSVLPPQSQGNANSSGINVALDRKNFYIRKMSLQEQHLRIIDDYFSMFGYSTKEVKVPNITGRPSWNYVKTIDIKIVGSVPADDMGKIKANYNKGITFWHGNWVGDYGRNNNL